MVGEWPSAPDTLDVQPAAPDRHAAHASMRGEERIERVLAEHGALVRRVAATYERDPAAREDLLQEILLALWRALPRFRGESSERTFVLRVAHNRGLTHAFRRRARGVPLEEADAVPDPRPGPEHEASLAQRRERLLAALHRLPLAVRQILSLALEGLSGAEVAALLGITENNANVRLSRARRALRAELERGGELP
jgi:RNA polymerase sigma factor (sigma-70 family)